MLDWEKYIAVADRFQHKARREDREDLNHTIILSLVNAQIRLDKEKPKRGERRQRRERQNSRHYLSSSVSSISERRG